MQNRFTQEIGFLGFLIIFSSISTTGFGQKHTEEGAFHSVSNDPIQLSDVPSGSKIFESSELLKIKIETNVEKLLMYKDDAEYQKAFMHIRLNDSITIVKKINVKVRGNTRIKICDTPPLKIDIRKNDFKWEGLKGINSMKVVTTCKDGKDYSQSVLKEYIAYKGFNLVSDVSYRTRLVELTLSDNQNRVDPIVQFAFLIESDRMLKKRTDCKEITSKETTTLNLVNNFYANPDSRTLLNMNVMAIYQYMIGNTDWGVTHFHNMRVLSINGVYFPVPFDFDYAGMIGTDYAIPSSSLPIESVKERHYLGPCTDIAKFQEALNIVTSKKAELYALWEQNPYLRKKDRTQLTNYIDSFFEEINDANSLKAIANSNCQN